MKCDKFKIFYARIINNTRTIIFHKNVIFLNFTMFQPVDRVAAISKNGVEQPPVKLENELSKKIIKKPSVTEVRNIVTF